MKMGNATPSSNKVFEGENILSRGDCRNKVVVVVRLVVKVPIPELVICGGPARGLISIAGPPTFGRDDNHWHRHQC